MIFFTTRQPRVPGPPLAGYPAPARRLIFWFDALTDWQRLQYAAATILFLIACTGYLLGLGSTMVVQRVELESAALAAIELPTLEPTPEPSPPLVVVGVATATPTPRPSATVTPPTPAPTQTPFSGPRLAEPPAVPRALPAAPVFVPAPARPTATPERPRNIETEPTGIPTRTPIRATTSVPTRPTTGATSRPGTPGVQTPLPTLALPGTRIATSVPGTGATPATPPPATPTAPRTLVPARTPQVR